VGDRSQEAVLSAVRSEVGVEPNAAAAVVDSELVVATQGADPEVSAGSLPVIRASACRP
jgi:hypothetical protein